jgi:four helix bundle protein
VRDHKRLRVFGFADELAISVYRSTAGFPDTERYGLQSQLRRAAISIAANIVEGCARHSEADYVRFLDMAFSSSRELQYEIDLSFRLGYFEKSDHAQLQAQATSTSKSLNALLRALRKS